MACPLVGATPSLLIAKEIRPSLRWGLDTRTTGKFPIGGNWKTVEPHTYVKHPSGMRVFLAGATGAVGRCLLPRLVRDGHEVTAMTRSPDRADWIRSLGAQPVVCDVFRKDELFRAVQAARPEVVIHQLTRIPARINPRHIARDLATTNRLRTEGTFALVEAAQAAGARRFIAQSVAFFYNPNERTPVPEDDPLDSTIPGAGEIVDALRVHEHVVLGASRMEVVVLRYGQFYGPGTFYASDGSFAEDVRRRRVPVVGEGGGVFSFVHVDDAAAAAAALAVTSTEPGIYNIVLMTSPCQLPNRLALDAQAEASDGAPGAGAIDGPRRGRWPSGCPTTLGYSTPPPRSRCRSSSPDLPPDPTDAS